MPRRKLTMELIPNRRARAAAFARRKEGLKKKARELSTLCDVKVALVCADGGGGGAAAEVWESEEGVLAAYRGLGAAERARHTHRAHAERELGKAVAKLARVRQGGPAALAPWHKELDGVTPEEARRLLGAIDAALAAANERMRALGLPDGGGGGLIEEGIAPGASNAGASLGLGAAPPCTESDFFDVESFMLTEGNGNEQVTWDDNGFHPSSAAMMQQPGYGFPPGNAATVQRGYGLQCPSSMYAGMDGYWMQQVAGNAGVQLQPNLAMWSTGGGEYPSLDGGLGYMGTPAAQAVQGTGGRFLAMGAGGNIINTPPALSLTMGAGDNFAGAPPAQPLAMSYRSDLVNFGSHPTRWPDHQKLQSPGSSQQSGLEQLHYLSDLEDTQLHLWGN